MAGKTRPSLRAKTLQNVALSNLSLADKQCIQSVFEKFEALSKADVEEVKHGFNTGNANIFECSVCGYGVDDIYEADEKNYPVWEFNFCPHCGAKMDGGNAE